MTGGLLNGYVRSRKMKGVKKLASIIYEETLPFVLFLCRYNEKIKAAKEVSDGKKNGEFDNYQKLGVQIIKKRLEDEHIRAISIDEKTLKFATSLSIVLAIASFLQGLLLKSSQNDLLKLLISITTILSIIYALIAFLLALGALKTLPTYGYATSYYLQLKTDKKSAARALAAQETVNLIRQLRNEAAFQCLRNAVLIFLVSVILSILLIYAAPPQKSLGTFNNTDKSGIPNSASHTHNQTTRCGTCNGNAVGDLSVLRRILKQSDGAQERA